MTQQQNLSTHLSPTPTSISPSPSPSLQIFYCNIQCKCTCNNPLSHWSVHQDLAMLKLRLIQGNIINWRQIHDMLHTRTQYEIKLRYQKLIKSLTSSSTIMSNTTPPTQQQTIKLYIQRLQNMLKQKRKQHKIRLLKLKQQITNKKSLINQLTLIKNQVISGNIDFQKIIDVLNQYQNLDEQIPTQINISKNKSNHKKIVSNHLKQNNKKCKKKINYQQTNQIHNQLTNKNSTYHYDIEDAPNDQQSFSQISGADSSQQIRNQQQISMVCESSITEQFPTQIQQQPIPIFEQQSQQQLKPTKNLTPSLKPSTPKNESNPSIHKLPKPQKSQPPPKQFPPPLPKQTDPIKKQFERILIKKLLKLKIQKRALIQQHIKRNNITRNQINNEFNQHQHNTNNLNANQPINNISFTNNSNNHSKSDTVYIFQCAPSFQQYCINIHSNQKHQYDRQINQIQ